MKYFAGTITIKGDYHFTGQNDSKLSTGYSAKLKVDHTIDTIIEVPEYKNHINLHDYNLDRLIDRIDTAIFKANSFRNDQTGDTVCFAPNGKVSITYQPFETDCHVPKNKIRLIRDTHDLKNLSKLLKDPYALEDIPSPHMAPDFAPMFNSLKNSFFDLFATPYASGPKITITGEYQIKANSDPNLAENTGFTASLDIIQKIDATLDSSSSRSHDFLNAMLSTALSKAKAFRSKECADQLVFSGKMAVNYPEQSFMNRSFDILNLYSFEQFIDCIQDLPLSANHKYTQQPSKQPLLLGNNEHKADNTPVVMGCAQRLRSLFN